MKQGWEIKKAQEIAKIISGYSFNSKDFSTENVIKSVKITNVGVNEFIEEADNYLPEKYKDTLNDFQVKEGNIVIALTRTIISAGLKVAIIPESYDGALLNQRVAALIPNHEIIHQWYLYHFLCTDSVKEYVKSNVNTLMQPNLSINDLKNLLVPCPPLPEQHRIVAILDEAFAAIAKAKANAQQNLKNAKELFDSYLQSVFENKGAGWEEKTLAQISKTFGRGKSKHRPRNWVGLYGGKYPFIQTGDIRNCNHFITEYTQTYNEAGLAQSKLWKAGTICITIAANIAETGILTFDACFPDSVIGIEVNEKFADRDFVEYLLQSFKVRIQALGKGSAQANINMGTFENELFPFPPVKEQQNIVQKLDALSAQTKKLEAIYQQHINDLDELKKSVLQKAFRGELHSPEGAGQLNSPKEAASA